MFGNAPRQGEPLSTARQIDWKSLAVVMVQHELVRVCLVSSPLMPCSSMHSQSETRPASVAVQEPDPVAIDTQIAGVQENAHRRRGLFGRWTGRPPVPTLVIAGAAFYLQDYART
jgi:hypothetical protein